MLKNTSKDNYGKNDGRVIEACEPQFDKTLSHMLMINRLTR